MFPTDSAQGRQNMTDLGIEAAKTAPPGIVAAFIWFGHTPEQWVSVLTIFWLLLLIGFKLRDEYRKAKRKE
jgi:hypothetical protein